MMQMGDHTQQGTIISSMYPSGQNIYVCPNSPTLFTPSQAKKGNLLWQNAVQCSAV